jgi:hypothetical protein
MQLMAGTAKDLGVDRKDVDQNIYGGAMYLKQMMDKYKDPQLALAAYNAGPGRLDKALRSQAGLSALPRETQGYMRYAEGGEVQHYDIGGEIDTVGAELDALRSGTSSLEKELMRGGSRGGSKSPELQAAYENALGLRREKEAQYEALMNQSGVGKPSFFPQSSLSSKRPEANPVVQRESTKTPRENIKQTSKEALKEDQKEPARIDLSQKDLQSIFANHTAMQQANPERDVFAEMIADNAKRRADIKESAKEDKNLAMLAAGLGILGGTSQYAMENIGKGAQKGVESYSASKNRRAAEQNALSSADLKALYYGQENQRKNRALTEGMRDKDLDNLFNLEKALQKQYFIEGMPRTPKQEEAYRNALLNSPLYQALAKNAGVTQQAPKTERINFSSIGR